jgi:hypothetical protein
MPVLVPFCFFSSSLFSLVKTGKKVRGGGKRKKKHGTNLLLPLPTLIGVELSSVCHSVLPSYGEERGSEREMGGRISVSGLTTGSPPTDAGGNPPTASRLLFKGTTHHYYLVLVSN